MARKEKTKPCEYCEKQFKYFKATQNYCSLSCSARGNGLKRAPELRCAECHAFAGVRLTESANLLGKNKSLICAWRKTHGLANKHKWEKHKNSTVGLLDALKTRIINGSWNAEYRQWVSVAKATEWKDQTPSYERQKERFRRKYADNKDYYREYQKRIYSTPEQRVKRREANREWSRRNREYKSQWAKRNPEKAKASRRRANAKPVNRIKRTMCKRIRELCGCIKGKSQLIGCTSAFLKEHLQSQFKDGMNWDNYGSVWHVDHIKPLASFDLFNLEHRKQANNWSNLRPMFAKENQAKRDAVLTHAELGGNLFGWAA
jgi:hypothetical protein